MTKGGASGGTQDGVKAEERQADRGRSGHLLLPISKDQRFPGFGGFCVLGQCCGFVSLGRAVEPLNLKPRSKQKGGDGCSAQTVKEEREDTAFQVFFVSL